MKKTEKIVIAIFIIIGFAVASLVAMFAYNLATPCKVFLLDSSQLAWIKSFHNDQRIVFKNEKGKEEVFKVHQVVRDLGVCNKIEVSDNQYEYATVKILMPIHRGYDVNCMVHISVDAESTVNPLISFCGVDIRTSTQSKALSFDKVEIKGVRYEHAIRFELSNGSKLNNDSTLKSIIWDRELGLIQYETYEDGIFNLSKKTANPRSGLTDF